MPRPRRKPVRRRRASKWLIAIQIILLSMALLVILFFRDLIAGGASSFFGTFGTDDIHVDAPEDAGNSSKDATPKTSPQISP